jgi:hypothetical protein
MADLAGSETGAPGGRSRQKLILTFLRVGQPMSKGVWEHGRGMKMKMANERVTNGRNLAWQHRGGLGQARTRTRTRMKNVFLQNEPNWKSQESPLWTRGYAEKNEANHPFKKPKKANLNPI